MNNNDLLRELFHSVAEGNIENVEHLLAQDNTSNIINALYDGSSIDLNGSALHEAACRGNINITTLLLNNGANVNIQNRNGNTPLHFAIEFNSHIDMLRLLLNNGADVNLQNTRGIAPLHCVISINCNIDRIQLLLDSRANINLQANNGETILHTAAAYGLRDVVEFLLNNNADVNINDKSGKTPVHFAAENSRQGVVQLLLGRYPDMVNLQDNDDKTALYLVAEHYFYILSGNHHNPEFRQDIDNRDKLFIDTSDTLLNMGADLNIKDNDGQTALHLAVLGYSTNLNEAYLNVADGNLDSFSCRSIDLIKSLCKNNNVNFMLKNNDGDTVLDLALAIEHDQHKIAEHLQEKRLLWRTEQIDVVNESLTIIARNKEQILKPDSKKNDADKFLENWCELVHLGINRQILDALHDDDFGTFQQLNEERKVALGENTNS